MNRPRKGQRYRSTADLEVGGLTLFAAPASGGFRACLPCGETVTVEFDPPPHATAVSARPDRYGELEPTLVPEADRKNGKYVGYALVIDLNQLANHFEEIRDA
jgi:hypothetical protein